MKKQLSKKEKGFIKDYIKTGNATEAITRNYNVKDRIVAKSMGSENLAKPYIQAKVKSIADSIPDELLTEKHLALLNKIDNQGEVDVNAVKAGLDMAYKIKSTYAPEKIKLSGELRFGELENLTNEELVKLATGSTTGDSEEDIG